MSLNLFAFFSLKLFPEMVALITLQSVMMIFAVASIVGVVFVAFVVKETNGKCMSTMVRQ